MRAPVRQHTEHGLAEVAAGRVPVVPPLQGPGVQAQVVLRLQRVRQVRSVAVEGGPLRAVPERARARAWQEPATWLKAMTQWHALPCKTYYTYTKKNV